MIGVQRIRDVFIQEIVFPRIISDIMKVSIFVILTSLGAFVRIPLPFTPVPITLQTLFVLLSGVILGSRRGGISQFLYLFLGAIGLPIFAGASSGLLHLAGPTGGYIIGFVLAAFIIGKVARKSENNLFHIISAMSLGTVVIYLAGGVGLACTLKIGIKEIFYLGIAPFIPGDMIKLATAALIAKAITFISSSSR
ncbi:MAG: biotin transporter BioY [Candidatus Aerophobetes bacterium]|nr:biotin transporter BioY [Candidatus Aerophobetes bacterium]